MTALPNDLALTTIADAGDINAAPLRNDFAAVQAAFNQLNDLLAGGVSGQLLVSGGASAINWLSAYTSYTPAWTSSGVAPAIGNGTITGSYLQLGKLVVGSITLTMGSTTTFGTGSFLLSLPVAAAGGGSSPVGSAVAIDVSASAQYVALPLLVSSTTIQIVAATGTTGSGANSPFIFAVGDSIIINFSYQAA